MVLYRYRQKYAFQMKYYKKKNKVKNLVLKYPEIRSNVSTIPWCYKKKIVNRPILYTRHYYVYIHRKTSIEQLYNLSFVFVLIFFVYQRFV